MFVIWGTDELAQWMYRRIPEAERSDVCLLLPDGRSAGDAGREVCAMECGQLPVETVSRLLVPADGRYGLSMARDRAICRSLQRKTGLPGERIWMMDGPTFDRELTSHGSLAALLASDTLPYWEHMEFEAVHHCNLNCKGCSHFSPLSQKKFADPVRFSRDLSRIREMIDHIGHLQLMGGEPLLHPELHLFVEESRRIYPYAEINVVTNGILLNAVTETLRDTMRRTGAIFRVTLYPPVRGYVEDAMRRMEQTGVRCESSFSVREFVAELNPDGTSDPAKSYAGCPVSHCTIFEEGRLSRCAMAHKIPVFEAHYRINPAFPDCSLDLYAKELTPRKLGAFLAGPIEMCRYCGKPRQFPWATAGKVPRPDDWYGNGPVE